MAITLELCQSNSIGNRFIEPTVKEVWTVKTQQEADEEISKDRPNGYYVRVATDKTGNK